MEVLTPLSSLTPEAIPPPGFFRLEAGRSPNDEIGEADSQWVYIWSSIAAPIKKIIMPCSVGPMAIVLPHEIQMD